MWNLIKRLLGRPAHHNTLSVPFLSTDENYTPPAWASHLELVPQKRVGLGILPTPIHKWNIPGLPEGIEVFIKRDDMSGHELSGNKVRKLEFLLAQVLAGGHDCVVTIGGIQSNHCRATAVAARYLGLDCHLVLRTSRAAVGSDPGLVGNLLLDRLSGAHVHLVTKEEYARTGGQILGETLVEQLREQGLNPYLIPVGGSNALGTWGYLQAVEEIRQQTQGWGVTDIVMACGSGGTTAGLALGAHLAGLGTRVHAYGVCDDPDYFYNFVDALIADLGADKHPDKCGGSSGGTSTAGPYAARALLRAVQAKGLGYAMSTDEEMRTVKEVAEATGICLDPVYSGKALHGLLGEMRAHPDAWRGRKVLFVHTGGLLGMFDKIEQLGALYTGSTDAAAGTAGAGAGEGVQGGAGSSPYAPQSRVQRLQLR